MEKELAESCEGAVHSDVKYTSRKTERTRNQNKMEQQNFGQSGQVYYQPPIQLFLQAEVAKNVIYFSDNFFGDFNPQMQYFFSKNCHTWYKTFPLFIKDKKIEDNLNISPASILDEKSVAFLSLQSEFWHACCICTP